MNAIIYKLRLVLGISFNNRDCKLTQTNTGVGCSLSIQYDQRAVVHSAN